MGLRHPSRLLLPLLLAGSLLAADFGGLKPQGYVSDFAGVIDAASKQQLEAYCAGVKAATGAEIALVTLPSLQGEPIEDVANVMFRKWGIGGKSNNEGILLLLSIGERRTRLEVGYGLEPVIPDGYAGSVIREMRPALRDRNYAQAMADAARTIGQTIAKAKGVQITANPPMRRSRPSSGGFPVEVAYLVGGVILLALLSRGGRGGRGGGGTGNFIMGMLLGQLLGGGGGGRSRSGGGFGGYDSGDSFGGFGGGDSGGGGASSDW